MGKHLTAMARAMKEVGMTRAQTAKRFPREQKIPIEEVIVGDRIRKDYGDLSGLAESMRDLGLIQPIVLAPDRTLLAGGRRLEAAKSLGWYAIPFVSADIRDDAATLLKAERDENTCRKEMTASELVAVGLKLEELEAPAAKERQREAGGDRRSNEAKNRSSSKDDDRSGPRTRTNTIVSEAIGMSESQYARAKRIALAAEDAANPETQARAKCALEKLDAGEATVVGAYNEAFNLDTRGRKTADVEPAIPEVLPDPEAPAARKKSGPGPRHAVNLERVAVQLDGLAMGLDNIADLHGALTEEEASRITASLSKSIRSLNRIRSLIKENAK